MYRIYFVKFSYDNGNSFRVYRKIFFRNIIIDINKTLNELELNGRKNVFIDSIECMKG